jgi:hypothetical protein
VDCDEFFFVGKKVAFLQKTFSLWALCSAIYFLNFFGLYTIYTILYFKILIERKLKIKNPTPANPYLHSIFPP